VTAPDEKRRRSDPSPILPLPVPARGAPRGGPGASGGSSLRIRQGSFREIPPTPYYILVSGAPGVKLNDKGEELSLNALRPGDEFGDAALLASGIRTATVRCSTAVEALRLSRPDFLDLVRVSPALRDALELSARHAALRGFLYEFSNFGRLPAAAIRNLIQKLAPVDFSKGRTIIRAGDGPGPMFIVREGKARAFADADGRTRNLAFYREGDFFGELSALRGAPRSASVDALTDCRPLALPPEALRDSRPATRSSRRSSRSGWPSTTRRRRPASRWISPPRCFPRTRPS
jgi:CRP-like cAMP-binding protein